MNFSLKGLLSILIITALLLTSVILTAGIVYILYNETIKQLTEEKISYLQLINDIIHGDEAGLFGSKPDHMSEEEKEKIYVQISQSVHVLFFRVVEIDSGRIIYTSFPDEREGETLSDLPVFLETASYRDRVWENIPLRDISVRGWGNEGLWLGLNLDKSQRVMLIVVLQAVFFTIFFISLSYIGFDYLLKKMFVSPLDRIINNIRRLNSSDLNIKMAPKEKAVREIRELGESLDKMEKEFKDIHKRDQLISKLKTEFITVAAHQLRTPLSAIKWSIKMLLDEDEGEITPGQKDLLGKVYKTNERIIILIGDLLNVARIEEGKFGYKFDYIDINGIIRESIDEQKPLAEKRDVTINFLPIEKRQAKVKIDKQKIKLVIENLLRNAIRYNVKNGSVEISILPFQEDYLEVRIKDSGIGIPKKDVFRLFTKFFRGENAVKTETEGTGMGLFIAKNIIINHGGKIWLESEINKGSTFHFTLPLKEKLLPKEEIRFEEFIQDI